MKLLIATQAVDSADLSLGFFTQWIAELAPSYEKIIVICLYEGAHDLPDNVEVRSLGKERGRRSPLAYAISFKLLAWRLRREYDAVFVHMNQEYLLIAGPLWKLLGKRVYLWRNHYAGSFLTDIAAWFCDTVFATSTHSYTAKFRKTMLMPVGVDLRRFESKAHPPRETRSVLFFQRIAPAKRPDVFIEALGIALTQGASFIASVYGSPAPEDERYYESLKQRAEELGLHARVRFHPGVPHEEAPAVFATHQIYVNCSRSGMYDKTLFEAAASGCFVIAASDDYARLAGDASFYDGTPEDLARKIVIALEGGTHSQEDIAEGESLTALAGRLVEEMQPAGGRILAL